MITGYPEYETDPKKLGKEQQQLLRSIAEQIVSSHSSSMPIVAVLVKGHADVALRKPQGERETFEMQVSKKRAESAKLALQQEIRLLDKRNQVANSVKFNVIWVGSKEPLVKGRNPSEMTLNRRVEIFWARCHLPNPIPSESTKERIQRIFDLLNRQSIPGDRRDIQRTRLRCVFAKMRSNPNVEDLFLDGIKKVTLNGEGKPVRGSDGKIHFVWTPGPPKNYPGVSYAGNYGMLPQEEFKKFFDTVRSFLGGSNFILTQPNNVVLNALGDLDARIHRGIEKVDEHLNFNGIASDKTRLKMNDFIKKQQNNPNSIYSCYK